jgi:hypothetical protein
MTVDLDANGFGIFNADNIQSTLGTFTTVSVQDINNTDAPKYANIGQINAGVDYTLATAQGIPSEAGGSISMVIRCLDIGFKQTIYLHVEGFETKGVIRVLSNLYESDNETITNIKYGLDAAGTSLQIGFTCGLPSTTCEVCFYQNAGSNGTGLYTGFFIPVGGNIPTTFSSVISNYILVDQQSGTSNEFFVDGTMTSSVANINTLTDRAGTGITLSGTDLLCDSNNIKNANTVETAQLGSPFAEVALLSDINTNGKVMRSNAVAPDNLIKLESDLTMLGGKIINTLSISTDTINSNVAGSITVTNPIDMSTLKIQNLAAPTDPSDGATKLYVDTVAGGSGVQNPMTADLDCGGYLLSNVGALYTVSGTSIIQSNGVFLHGTAGGALGFTVSGTDTTFAPSSSWKITDPFQIDNKLSFDPTTNILSLGGTCDLHAETGSTIDVKSGSTLSTQAGSSTSIGGRMTMNGGDIERVNRIINVNGVDTGITATGAGSNIELTTTNEEVNIIASTLNCKDGNIITTNINAAGSTTAGSIVITNGVRGRDFDGALSVQAYGVDAIMDGRNHWFVEGYGNFFNDTEFPRQTAAGFGNFGMKCRVTLRDNANSFVSIRMIPQSSQNPGGITPFEINYSRLTFQGDGVAPVYQNDTTTVAPNVISCPALQQNRFQMGSELYFQVKCVYCTTTGAGSPFYAPLHYVVNFSGVESSGAPCSGTVNCMWEGNNAVQNTKFGFEVLGENIGGIVSVDEVELFNDGMVSSF